MKHNVETSKLAINPSANDDQGRSYAAARLAREVRQAPWNGYRGVKDITKEFSDASNGKLDLPLRH